MCTSVVAGGLVTAGLCYRLIMGLDVRMDSLPSQMRPPRRRVPPFHRAMIALSVAIVVGSMSLVLAHPHSRALVAFGNLFSHRTWRILQAVSFLLYATALGLARYRRRS
jgi:hypothetical protein